MPFYKDLVVGMSGQVDMIGRAVEQNAVGWGAIMFRESYSDHVVKKRGDEKCSNDICQTVAESVQLIPERQSWHKLQIVCFTASRDESTKVWRGTVWGCQEGSQGCSIWNISTYQHN